MTEEEKKAIEDLKDILKYWQTIVDIEDDVEREIEMTCYSEEMPFKQLKIALNLIEKLQKEKDEILNSKVGVDLSFDDYIPKDKIRKLEEMWNDNIWNATDEASEEKAEMIRDVYRGLLDE